MLSIPNFQFPTPNSQILFWELWSWDLSHRHQMPNLVDHASRGRRIDQFHRVPDPPQSHPLHHLLLLLIEADGALDQRDLPAASVVCLFGCFLGHIQFAGFRPKQRQLLLPYQCSRGPTPARFSLGGRPSADFPPAPRSGRRRYPAATSASSSLPRSLRTSLG